MPSHRKFLVELLGNLSHRQMFFLLWFAIVSVFVALMYSWYRKNTRRNFRTSKDGPRPMQAKSIPNLSHREGNPGGTEEKR